MKHYYCIEILPPRLRKASDLSGASVVGEVVVSGKPGTLQGFFQPDETVAEVGARIASMLRTLETESPAVFVGPVDPLYGLGAAPRGRGVRAWWERLWTRK